MERADWPKCNCIEKCACGDYTRGYIDLYLLLLAAVKPKIVQEWGPGTNTRAALATGAVVYSVEHDEAYRHPDMPKLIMSIVPLESMQYVTPITADLYFVDGRRRAECLMMIAGAASPRAVVCLHDAQRARYHDALSLFPFVEFVTNGIAIAGKLDLTGAVSLIRAYEGG
jgi:hypothetical protein